MLRERQGSGPPAAFTLKAPAKVNLFLEVMGRRSDGYHELRTLMVAVGLFDRLEFAQAPPGKLALVMNPPVADRGLKGRRNLVARAAELLRRRTGTKAGAQVTLTKRIPVSAGLGGGSSDAATALIGLNRLWQLKLSRDELDVLAAELGSDVAFFLRKPSAWCTGRGEVVEPWALGVRLHLVLVRPPFGLSTAEVYGALQLSRKRLDGSKIKSATAAGNVAAIGRHLHNRLQESALALRPELKKWLGLLAAQRPVGELLSGSGSTVFALARDAADARRIAAGVRRSLPPVSRRGANEAQVFVVRSM